MPSDLKQNKLRSFIQLSNESLTRTEFKAYFERATSLIKTAIGDLTQRIDSRIADSLAADKELSAKIDKKLRGLDGYTPVKGRDYSDGYTPLKGKDYFDGKDGETPIAGVDFQLPKPADEQAIGRRVTEQLVPRLMAALIPKVAAEVMKALHLDDKLAAHSKTILGSLGPGGGTSFSILQAGTQKVQQPLSLNFKGPGAPTITTDQHGVTNLDFPSGGSSGTAVYDEIPTGSGTAFALANTPTSGTVRLFRGGARQSVANGDYSITGANITLTAALASGETLTADYNH